MLTKKTSKILAVGFCYNTFQCLMLFVKGGEDINILATVSLAFPVIFISYLAMKMNKLAYVLVLYWFGIQALILSINGLLLNWDFGIKFEVILVSDKIGIDVAALLLFIISLFEIDNVFPEENELNPITLPEQKDESHLTSRST